MPKEVTRYQCEHCKQKTYSTKSNCTRHENDCYANFNVKACRTCKYYSKESETVYVPPKGDSNYGDDDYEREYLLCRVYQKELGKEIPFKSYCECYNSSNKDNFKEVSNG